MIWLTCPSASEKLLFKINGFSFKYHVIYKRMNYKWIHKKIIFPRQPITIKLKKMVIASISVLIVRFMYVPCRFHITFLCLFIN